MHSVSFSPNGDKLAQITVQCVSLFLQVDGYTVLVSHLVVINLLGLVMIPVYQLQMQQMAAGNITIGLKTDEFYTYIPIKCTFIVNQNKLKSTYIFIVRLDNKFILNLCVYFVNACITWNLNALSEVTCPKQHKT